MKIGERIEIERTLSGLYKVTASDGVYVGAAPSTIMALTNAVLKTEASEVNHKEHVHG